MNNSDTISVNKLVRDDVSNNLLHSKIAKSVNTRTVHGIERENFIVKKMLEEISEVISANTRTARIEELGDLYTILSAYAEHHGIAPKEIENAANAKIEKHGAFRTGTVMESIAYNEPRTTKEE